MTTRARRAGRWVRKAEAPAPCLMLSTEAIALWLRSALQGAWQMPAAVSEGMALWQQLWPCRQYNSMRTGNKIR